MIHSIFSFRSLVYIVYAILLTALLLYVRFPAEQFKHYCEQRVEKFLPDSTCTIDRIGYRFPLSAVYNNITLERVIDGQATTMVVEQLVVSAKSQQFWRTFSLTGKIYSGLFAAELDFDNRAHSFDLANIHVEGLQVGDLARSIGLSERKISGIIEFTGNYKAPTSAPGDGSGKGLVQVAAGNLSLLQPILNLSTLDFDKLTMHVTQQNGVIRLDDGEFLGKEIVADFDGELRIAFPFLNSNISLSGHMEPEEGFLRSNPQEQQAVQSLLQRYKTTVLPFKLGGTIQRPLFRFST